MGLLGKKKEIGSDTIIQRRNDLLFNEIDGEVVMLSVENSEYYGMNRVGSYIFQQLEDPLTFHNLVEIISKKYEVNKEQCFTSTYSFVLKLLDKDLIVIQ